MLDYYLLEQLTTFAKTGTLTKTAAALNITQPSVTRGMQKLEEDFGVQLFDRQANRIKLTPTGELAAREAEQLLMAGQTMLTKIQNFDRGQHFTIIGATIPGPLTLVPNRDDVQIAKAFIAVDQISNALQTDQAALIFSDQEILDTTIESQYLGQEQLQINLDQFTTFASQSTVSFQDLGGMSFVVMRAIGPWSDMIKQDIPNAQFMYQDDRAAFIEIIKHSSLPFFTSNLSQKDAFFNELSPHQLDRITVPISDEQAKMPIYANYLTHNKRQIAPILETIRANWP
ncbi:LysR family transcriptional regulator [Latilactobacillus sakei]|uniref:LysR family transcriptional regulator n=1 Tax=Latilactobacillus sakei TaxID=1599 RepID=UPI00033EBFA1|nr:LysR family transcriptional regulator [Latilactobacillus sakei]ARJ72225.1 LysR family transcriptional regulator [Latilactobacillus sakei]EOR85767.1 transcriptional regulator, LysR family [Latilactobacillus sakei subsp. sakei LS25]PKX63907.1 LysR family transcriptional regulator [Latilactobacillus sakei]PKX68814.1 LysR family transcriptional regulator [Latilactobacillus sakei]